MNIIELFPVPLGVSNIGRPLTKEELDFIDRLKDESRPNGSNVMSKNQAVLHEEPLTQLKSELESSINEYFHTVWCPTEDSDLEIYITASWFTWTYKEESHHVHAHPNSFISGTFYVSADDSDAIDFPNDRLYYSNLQVETHPEKLNIFNCQNYRELTKPGDIKLFPSTLKHYVSDKQSDYPRICLAFNTWIKGTIGHPDLSTELKVPGMPYEMELML